MATLITTTDHIKEFIAVNASFEFNNALPYIAKAERKYIKHLIGDVLYDAYCDAAPVDSTELKVYNLLREASANLCWFLFLPTAQVQISNSGIAVSQSDKHRAATWQELRDLRRSFLESGFEAIDDALKIMEANEDDFLPWPATEGYTIFKELFVTRTETFNRWHHINASRKTFLALRPVMLQMHHQYFTSQLNAATIATINLAVADIHKEVLDMLQASMVNFAIADVAETGTFEITSSGVYQKLEEFPGFKVKTLDETLLNKLQQKKRTAGEEYFKKAIALIEANAADFTDYTVKAVGTFVAPKDTPSIVSF